MAIGFAILVFALTSKTTIQAQKRIEDHFANVNGLRLHYLSSGTGDPVILLHGYAENSHMWRPLMVELARSHTVIAPDLRGFGQSSKPTTGYDKKTMAQDIHALTQSLGYQHEVVVGHDIQFAETKLTMPMLVLTGEKASGQFLIEQARLVDTTSTASLSKAKVIG